MRRLRRATAARPKAELSGLGGWADFPTTYRPISGRYRPNFEFWNLKNLAFLLFFDYFLLFFWPFSHFFSKWYFGGKMSPRTQKMTFLAFFSSSSWFISIFWWFLMFQKFEFFNKTLSFSLFSCTFQLKSSVCFDYYLEWFFKKTYPKHYSSYLTSLV